MAKRSNNDEPVAVRRQSKDGVVHINFHATIELAHKWVKIYNRENPTGHAEVVGCTWGIDMDDLYRREKKPPAEGSLSEYDRAILLQYRYFLEMRAGSKHMEPSLGITQIVNDAPSDDTTNDDGAH